VVNALRSSQQGRSAGAFSGQQYEKPLDEKYLMALRYGWDIVDEYVAWVQNGEATSRRCARCSQSTARSWCRQMPHRFTDRWLASSYTGILNLTTLQAFGRSARPARPQGRHCVTVALTRCF
jgi:hypothetical protein